jgi:hypothetical protein
MNMYSTDSALMRSATDTARSVFDFKSLRFVGEALPYRFVGDFDLLFSRAFFEALHSALRGTGDADYWVVCLSPDPWEYYYRHFRLFPICSFKPKDDPSSILKALESDPGGSPADAIGVRGDTLVLFSTGLRWFVSGTRDDEVLRVAFEDSNVAARFQEQLKASGYGLTSGTD